MYSILCMFTSVRPNDQMFGCFYQVRASQQVRYSTAYPPTNPESKSRECCRHVFAGCMKVPGCRLVCFRCILPSCLQGSDSDDEEAVAKEDEGYHSQNHPSSDMLPSSGAEGGADPPEVEMTDMKTDTAAPMIPPRKSLRANDYRSEPKRPATSGPPDESHLNYIEVESVPLNKTNSSPDIAASKKQALAFSQPGYEEPLTVCLPLLTRDTRHVQGHEVECNDDAVSDDSESNIYINEDILKPRANSGRTDATKCVERLVLEDNNYLNLQTVDLSKSCFSHSKKEVAAAAVDRPNNYINVPSVGGSSVETRRNVGSDVKCDVIVQTHCTSSRSDISTAGLTTSTPTGLKIKTEALRTSNDISLNLKSNDLETLDNKTEGDNTSDAVKLIVPSKSRDSSDTSGESAADDNADDNADEDGDRTKLL